MAKSKKKKSGSTESPSPGSSARSTPAASSSSERPVISTPASALTIAVREFVRQAKLSAYPRLHLGALQHFARQNKIDIEGIINSARSPIEGMTVSEYFDLLDRFEHEI